MGIWITFRRNSFLNTTQIYTIKHPLKDYFCVRKILLHKNTKMLFVEKGTRSKSYRAKLNYSLIHGRYELALITLEKRKKSSEQENPNESYLPPIWPIYIYVEYQVYIHTQPAITYKLWYNIFSFFQYLIRHSTVIISSLSLNCFHLKRNQLYIDLV